MWTPANKRKKSSSSSSSPSHDISHFPPCDYVLVATKKPKPKPITCPGLITPNHSALLEKLNAFIPEIKQANENLPIRSLHSSSSDIIIKKVNSPKLLSPSSLLKAREQQEQLHGHLEQKDSSDDDSFSTNAQNSSAPRQNFVQINLFFDKQLGDLVGSDASQLPQRPLIEEYSPPGSKDT